MVKIINPAEAKSIAYSKVWGGWGGKAPSPPTRVGFRVTSRNDGINWDLSRDNLECGEVPIKLYLRQRGRDDKRNEIKMEAKEEVAGRDVLLDKDGRDA